MKAWVRTAANALLCSVAVHAVGQQPKSVTVTANAAECSQAIAYSDVKHDIQLNCGLSKEQYSDLKGQLLIIQSQGKISVGQLKQVIAAINAIYLALRTANKQLMSKLDQSMKSNNDVIQHNIDLVQVIEKRLTALQNSTSPGASKAALQDLEDWPRKYDDLLRSWQIVAGTSPLDDEAKRATESGDFQKADLILTDLVQQEAVAVNKAAASNLQLALVKSLQFGPAAGARYFNKAYQLEPENPLYANWYIQVRELSELVLDLDRSAGATPQVEWKEIAEEMTTPSLTVATQGISRLMSLERPWSPEELGLAKTAVWYLANNSVGSSKPKDFAVYRKVISKIEHSGGVQTISEQITLAGLWAAVFRVDVDAAIRFWAAGTSAGSNVKVLVGSYNNKQTGELTWFRRIPQFDDATDESLTNTIKYWRLTNTRSEIVIDGSTWDAFFENIFRYLDSRQRYPEAQVYLQEGIRWWSSVLPGEYAISDLGRFYYYLGIATKGRVDRAIGDRVSSVWKAGQVDFGLAAARSAENYARQAHPTDLTDKDAVQAMNLQAEFFKLKGDNPAAGAILRKIVADEKKSFDPDYPLPYEKAINALQSFRRDTKVDASPTEVADEEAGLALVEQARETKFKRQCKEAQARGEAVPGLCGR
ncbi:hypothetical protein OKW43_008602 [Paraburkholderia sp. WC7.3g]|uniref:hypothetical protein n=1 Tax=Paraburkholderia sp. WC7.3g TaxID=2991070 RepID=UPI003D190565